MAKPMLVIQFPSPASSDLMGRVFNFLEDVHRGLMGTTFGSVESDIDHYASGRFVVRVSSARHLGSVSSLISKLLKQHNLESDATVSRADHLAQRSNT